MSNGIAFTRYKSLDDKNKDAGFRFHFDPERACPDLADIDAGSLFVKEHVDEPGVDPVQDETEDETSLNSSTEREDHDDMEDDHATKSFDWRRTKRNLLNIERVQWIRASYFFGDNNNRQIVRCQDVPPEWIQTEPDYLLFVSHRWISKMHPDPNRRQFEELRERIQQCVDVISAARPAVFYDYMSLPQHPRTTEETVKFKTILNDLGLIQRNCSKTIILEDALGDYPWRAWCAGEFAVGKMADNLPMTEMNISNMIHLNVYLSDPMLTAISSIGQPRVHAHVVDECLVRWFRYFSRLMKHPKMAVTSKSDLGVIEESYGRLIRSIWHRPTHVYYEYLEYRTFISKEGDSPW